jgi:hypothetical protein
MKKRRRIWRERRCRRKRMKGSIGGGKGGMKKRETR